HSVREAGSRGGGLPSPRPPKTAHSPAAPTAVRDRPGGQCRSASAAADAPLAAGRGTPPAHRPDGDADAGAARRLAGFPANGREADSRDATPPPDPIPESERGRSGGP